MNIAIVAHAYFPEFGGTQEVVRGLSKSLQAKSHRVVIITFTSKKKFNQSEIIDGVQVFRLKCPFSIMPQPGAVGFFQILELIAGLPATLIKLNRILKENDIQLINVHFVGINAFYVWMLSRFKRLEYILTLHGFNLQVLPFLKRAPYIIVNSIYKRILRGAVFISACSKALLDDAIERAPSTKNNSLIISNGINLEEFKHNGSPLINYPYVLSLGRLQSPYKGFDLLLFALKSVLDRGSNINLVIAGEGVDKANYQKLAGLLGLERNVYFFGKADRKQVVSLFKNCEFFVMPSRIEPFGIVNLEAMAAEKAVLATKTGGIPEVVDDGKTGILVEPCNDKALAQGMIKLLEDKDLRIQLGENGRKKIEEEGYSWDIVADSYLRMYKDALGIKPVSINFLHALKIKNREISERDFKDLNEICSAKPLMITVSDTTRCNLNCIMCFRNFQSKGSGIKKVLNRFVFSRNILNFYRNNKKGSLLDFNSFKKLAEQTFDYISVLNLSIAGEPFMNPNFSKILAEAEARKAKLVIYTNATLIPQGKLLTKLVNNLLLFIVSIDAANKKTYESIRLGARFDRVIENIRRFNLERGKIEKDSRPKLIFRTVLMRRNIEELPDYVRLAHSLGADAVGACHMTVFGNDLKNESLIYHKQLANRYLKQAKELIAVLKMETCDYPPLFEITNTESASRKSSLDRPCIYPWRGAFIEANGDAYPCCAPDRSGLLMGNINNANFEDIWNGERYRLLRRSFKNGDLYPPCRNCYLRIKDIYADNDSLYFKV